ncbi:SDR family NAD(P)-dependent oxidoreductase [Neobacillus novalis]|uniref:SDR family NAD(P)-dependent oxidoreductase n=1 Tax=Neobacillus novalis TaxID=220687 RepID=A0AA95MI35_9BACI|nr:SDR family NAD(P)-dependent oxidoreductase [Neobacillus novalis]WHY83990.1 SDR family NAD(P)-dependent oxidoreductase [Neobacillus novalis]
MKLEGKVACITGSAGGLGYAMAKQMAIEGAIVVMNDLDETGLQKAVDLLKNEGFKVNEYAANIANKDQVTAMMKFIYDSFGRIDILVNNAGGSLHTPKKLEEIMEEHWDLVLDVNLKGTFLCSQAVVPYMKAKTGGSIINVASIGGRTASIVTGVAYAAAKGGIISFTRRLAKEIGRYGIRVNAIAPGLVISGERMQDTWENMNEIEQNSVLEEIPLRRLGSIEEQASVVTFLASNDSHYMTGAILDVNGGRFMG